jgi:predicted RNase H-like HicB family nuclease
MRTSKKKMKLQVEKTDTGFSAFSVKYPVSTTGESFTELLQNAVEALNLYFMDQDIRINEKNIEFEIDLKQFFQYYRVINSKFLARRIGMNESLLSQYATGRKKPSSVQTNKILSGIHEIGRELSNIQFFIHRPE